MLTRRSTRCSRTSLDPISNLTLYCQSGRGWFAADFSLEQESSVQFRNMIQMQQPWVGQVPCYPGIGESLWADRDITRLIEQIKITRELGTGGFIVFNYAMPQARRTVPLCGKGITRRIHSIDTAR